MKHLRVLLIIFTLLILATCGIAKKSVGTVQKVEVLAEDSLEYQLIIMDPKFETFLLMQPSSGFYSQNYYQSWNQLYATEWNMRHSNPIRYGSFYQTAINYDSFTDYGLDLNYRLYNYFRFIEKEYGIRLVNRGR